MKNKLLLLALFCTLFLSIGCVCATDADINVENLSSTGDISVVSNDLGSDGSNGVDEGSNSTNEDVIGSFSDIQKRIDEAKENDIILLNNTTYFGNGSRIVVNKSITIDGNGSTLDGLHKSRIFDINASNVVLINLNLINGGGYNNNSIPPYDDIGGAIYWVGNNGKLINSTISNNYAYDHGAITWSGSNGTIINTNFKNNTGFVFIVFTGPIPSYSFISGVVNGFYDGDLIEDSYLRNVSVNSNLTLKVNNSVVYGDYLVVSLVDDNGLPYFNDSVKVRIYNDNYECYLESVIDDNGVAKIKLPSNLSAGKYNITYYLKKIISSHGEYPNYPPFTVSFTDRVLCYDYADYWVNNSSLSVLKCDASLNSSGLGCVYGSDKYLYVKLVDSKGDIICNSSVLFKVCIGKGKYKSYNVKTDSNGIATLKQKFKPGKYSVIISSTNPNCNVGNIKTVMKISKIPTITKALKVTNKYHKKAYFKVKILNKTKKAITNLKLRIKVYTGKKYKTYTLKTNSKGLAYLNTKNLNKGRHKVVISSANNVFAVNKSSCIVIKK